MNKIINNIFEYLHTSNSELLKVADQNTEQEIQKLLEPLRTNLTDEEYVELRDILFAAAHIAGKEMFSVGFYFAVNLLCKKL